MNDTLYGLIYISRNEITGEDAADLASDDIYALLTEHLFEAEVGKQQVASQIQ